MITGLVVSALFAAAMSSVDSGINSITAVVMTDIFHSPADEDDRHFVKARILAAAIGGYGRDLQFGDREGAGEHHGDDGEKQPTF